MSISPLPSSFNCVCRYSTQPSTDWSPGRNVGSLAMLTIVADRGRARECPSVQPFVKSAGAARGHAAVDVDRRAADVAGVIRCQEADDVGDLDGLADAAKGDPRTMDCSAAAGSGLRSMLSCTRRVRM